MILQSGALFLYFIGFFLVMYGEVFGNIGNLSPVSLAGMIIILMMGLIMALLQLKSFNIIIIKNIDVFASTSLLVSLITILGLIFIVTYYGMPPTFYYLLGGLPPEDLLNGNYRDMLPLRALVPPLVLVNSLTLFLIRNNTKRIKFAKLISITTVILLVMVYETRHVILWLFIYLVQSKIYTIKQFMKYISLKRLIQWSMVFAIVWFLFIAVGNYRSGITMDDGERFANAMAIDSQYADLNIGIIWGIIYAFGGIARGVANASNINIIDFSIKKYMLPGSMQFLVDELHLDKDYSYDTFSKQSFITDSWHELCNIGGFVGGVIVFTSVILLFCYFVYMFNSKLKSGRYVTATNFAIFLWVAVRIILLPIGNYLLNFSALIELILMISFFNAVGLQLRVSK